MNHYLIFINVDGSASWSTYLHTYLFGVYNTKEEAETAVDSESFKMASKRFLEKAQKEDEWFGPFNVCGDIVEFDSSKEDGIDKYPLISEAWYME